MFTITPTSPHHSPRRAHRVVSVVMHATASASAASALAWFRNPASRVSAHYVIDKTGHLWLVVPEGLTAWHAGLSDWRGLGVPINAAGARTLNPVSIGIELVNLNDHHDPYPPRQIEVAALLCAQIAARYEFSPAHICGHYECSPGRKTDPAGLDMDAFRARVAQILEVARGR